MCQKFSKREEIMHVELNLTFANKFHSMSLVRYLILGLFVNQFAVLFGQDTMAVHTPFSSNVINVKNETSDIGFSGFYRFLGFVRNQENTFPNNSGKTTAIIVGDYYREPMLLLKFNGMTRDKVSFGADFMINSVYKGPSEELNQSLTLNLGLNLRTSLFTDFGNFTIKSGGVSWYRQSRLTVWGNRSFNRMSIYDRRPQTPLTKRTGDRYTQYYNSGLIDQGVRYGSRAFQGLFLNGNKLPLNFSVKGVVGKSNFNRSELITNDNFTGCFKVKNDVTDSLMMSYNYLISSANVDSLTENKRKYEIHTFELERKWKTFKLQLEAGVGNYSSPESDLGYGEAIVVNVTSNQSAKVPLNIQLYRVSPQFVNVTGNFLNTSVLEVFPNVSGVGTTVRTPYKSPIVGLGFPANNRQGVSINVDAQLGQLKFNGGIGVSAEIDTSFAGLTYIHNVNSETLSRLYLFAQGWGPYNNLNSIYRRVFQEVSISDTTSGGMSNFKKHFSTVEFQAKYHNQIFDHDFYVFSLTKLNSCQKTFLPVPQRNPNSNILLTQLSQEFDFIVELTEKTSMVMSYGVENVLGSNETELGDTPEQLPRNQTNTLVGVGFDYRIGSNAMMFMRHNIYRYKDPNFIDNDLKGTETMLELKFTF